MKKTPCDTTGMRNLKKRIQMNLVADGNRLTDFENKLMVTKGDRWGDALGFWNWHRHSEVYRMTGQWAPPVWHGELSFFLFFCFLGPHQWHMKVPRLGDKSEL